MIGVLLFTKGNIMSKLPVDFYIEEVETPLFTQERINTAFQNYCKKYYDNDLNYHLMWWGVDKEYGVIDIEFATTEKGLPVQPRSDRCMDMVLPFNLIK